MAFIDQRQEQLATAFAQRSVQVGNATISYREYNSGGQSQAVARGALTVVALHGIGSAAASWLDVAQQFSHARFVAWDAPGYGASSALSQERPTARDYADVLRAWMDALQIERCVLVGHSLGALMAAGYLGGPADHRVRQAVLLSPARGYGADAAESQRVRTERIQTLQTLGLPEMARLRSARLLSEFASDQAREWVRWNMAQLHPAGYRQAIELLCGDDIARYTPSFAPVDVFCGAQDVVTTPAACAQVARGFGAELALIERAGHASPCEAPIAVAHAIQSSCQRHWQSDVKAHAAFGNPGSF